MQNVEVGEKDNSREAHSRQEMRKAERLAERGNMDEAVATLDYAISLGADP